MNIIFDTENLDQIKNNNILLELDTFYFTKQDKIATAYCVVDNFKITEFAMIDQQQKLHAEMISAYKNKNFVLCQDLLEQLVGTFNGEVDSFYAELTNRIIKLDSAQLSNDWNPIICRED
jgi:hypothetical protein